VAYLQKEYVPVGITSSFVKPTRFQKQFVHLAIELLWVFVFASLESGLQSHQYVCPLSTGEEAHLDEFQRQGLLLWCHCR